MVYSSAGVGELLRYSRHVLHNRLEGPSEGNTRSHRRQSRWVSSIFLEGDLGIAWALRAMLFSFLSVTVRALPLEYPRISMSKCHTAGTASGDLRALADAAETPLNGIVLRR
jgi:hypothetical protein